MLTNEAQVDAASLISEHRALLVLRLLAGQLNGASNEALLSDLLDHWALGGSRDTLRACYAGLEQSELVTITMTGECMVLRLTRQGEEVANGKTRAPGVLPVTVSCPY